MKKISFLLAIALCLQSYNAFSQSGESSFKTVNISKNPVKEQTSANMPNIIIKNPLLLDSDGNNQINANEKCNFTFTLENRGTVNAYNIQVYLSETNYLTGLKYEPIHELGNLPPGKELAVTIPIEGTNYLKTAKADFEILIKTSNGPNTTPLEMSINTRELSSDYVSDDLAQNQTQYRGSGDPLKGLNVSKAKKEMEIGDYFALIIGIDQYKGEWEPLNNAVNDAKTVEELLKTKYKFNHFRTLYNGMATRKNIIKELEWLVENVNEKDNVLIFYSGHGEFKQTLNKGYWVPFDALSMSTYEYISNSEIQTFLNGIKSKHTLLVSDACFSGDIFRGKTISVPFENSERYYNEVHNLVSRQAITSGGIEPVMDGGRDGHSVFTYYFLKSLKNNENKYFDASQLYNSVKIPVTNNSEQFPKLSPIKNTGDEGGQFIFIKK